jgi:hypothetical protein
VINIKWGAVAGAAAFVLSFAIGLTSGASFLFVLLRALIFGAVFFGLGLGIWIGINSFIPELLQEDYGGGGEDAPPGSRVNITLDDRTFARPEQYQNPENPDEVGNIADLLSGKIKLARYPAPAAPSQGIDQNPEDRYNEVAEDGFGEAAGRSPPETYQGQSESPAKSAAAFTPAFGSDEGLGGLPDLDALAGAFLSNPGEDFVPVAAAAVSPAAPVQAAAVAAEAPQRKSTSGKPTPLQGDFNPKDLAEGIRTILNKDT